MEKSITYSSVQPRRKQSSAGVLNHSARPNTVNASEVGRLVGINVPAGTARIPNPENLSPPL